MSTPGLLETTCCVVGGGPAGMMLGFLLARKGVPVVVLEKHADFFRDFRGDSVHPSTLELLYELGLLDEFLKLPHHKIHSVGGTAGDFEFRAADFRYLPTRCKFVALVPQWDFLSFLARHALKFPNFDLRVQHEVVDLIEDGGRVTGVKVKTPDSTLDVRADLVVACDGRHSTLRRAAKLPVIELGVPIDVLWFRMSRNSHDPENLLGKLNYGGALVLINRGAYYQVGFIIRKGSLEELKGRGLDPFRNRVRLIAPYLGNRVDEIQSWDQIKLLSVQINRLERWYGPGLLCIGDAAHAMSPAGGVGINLAVQDAVAAANVLSRPLRDRSVTEAVLARIQRRREFPARATQLVQANAHRVFARVFENSGPFTAPWQLKAAMRLPGLRFVLGRAIGMGVRPEHVDSVPGSAGGKTLATRLAVGAGVALAIAVVFARTRRQAQS